MSVLLKVLTGLVSLAVMGAVSVTDPTGDAVGDGTIVAPTAPRYANSAIFDLQDVSIEVLQDASGGSIILLPAEPDAAEDDAEVGPSAGDDDAPAATSSVVLTDVRSVLRVTLGAIDVSESTALGFGSVVIDLYLDGAPGGRETTLEGPGMFMPAGRGWEYAVRLTPDGATGFRYVAPPVAAVAADLVVEPVEDAGVGGETEDTELDPPTAPAADYERIPVGVSLLGPTLTVELPWDFPDEVVVYALSGVHDPFNPTGWRPLADAPSPWAYSGGEQVVPVVDLVAPDQEAQDKALRSGVLPLPAIAVPDNGLLWLLIMALGLCVAAAGLLLRRRVPGPAKRQLRTGLPPEPVDETLVPAPKLELPVTTAVTDEPAAQPQLTEQPSADVGARRRDSEPVLVIDSERGAIEVPGTDSPGLASPADSPLATSDAETPTVNQEDAEPALSGISAFDSYVLSEEWAEEEEQDTEGFDDLTQDQTQDQTQEQT